MLTINGISAQDEMLTLKVLPSDKSELIVSSPSRFVKEFFKNDGAELKLSSTPNMAFGKANTSQNGIFPSHNGNPNLIIGFLKNNLIIIFIISHAQVARVNIIKTQEPFIKLQRSFRVCSVIEALSLSEIICCTSSLV